MRFTEQSFKTILNKQQFIDGWFWCRYTLNPYNGCRFGCVYCDARSEKYRMPEDFEDPIVVKKDPGELLDARLTRGRTLLPDIVALGGATDCYQPAEKVYRNTRACLRVLLKHGYGAHIITKSNLAADDLELLRDIGLKSWSSVSFTITTMNREVSRFLDKRAPDPAKRMRAVTAFKNGGARTGVLLIPLVPGLCDSEADLRILFQTSRDAGADYILFGGGMTLRDRQGLWFLKHLYAYRPDLMELYENLYGFSYHESLARGTYTGSFTPHDAYFRGKNRLLLDLAREYELPFRIPRYIPGDHRRLNYIIAERLLGEAYTRQITGGAWSEFHWAGHNIQNLDRSIAEFAQAGRLKDIRNVRGDILTQVETWIREEDDEPDLFTQGRF